MGCGASASVATKEQKEKMCVASCRLMMVACLEHVINVEVIEKKSTELKISPPGDQVKDLKALAKDCRNTANEATAKFAESQEEAKAEAGKAGTQAAASVGGMLAGMGAGMGAVAAAANVAKTVADTAGAVAAGTAGITGSAISMAFTAVADALDSAIAPVEEDFSKVAQNLVESKKENIFEIYNKIIAECAFADATTLVRGAAPHGAKEYAAVDSGSVSHGFNKLAEKDLTTELSPHVEEFAKDSKAVKAWEKAIAAYNDANAQLGKTEATKSLQKPAITLDVKAYIVKATIERLTVMMAMHEAVCRKEPIGKVKQRMATFEACFCKEDIMHSAYQAFEKGQ